MGLFLSTILCSAYTGGDEVKRCTGLSCVSYLVRAVYTYPPRTAREPGVFSKQGSAAHLISLLLSTSPSEAGTPRPDALQSLPPLLTTACFHFVGVSSPHFFPQLSLYLQDFTSPPPYLPGHFAKSLSLPFPRASQTSRLLKGVLRAQEKRLLVSGKICTCHSRPPPIPGTVPTPPAAVTPSRSQLRHSLPAGNTPSLPLLRATAATPTASVRSSRQLV